MADNNRNWNNQYQQSNNDWDQNRNRFEDEDRNREDDRYDNTNYGSNYQKQSMRGGWNNRSSREMGKQSDDGGAYISDYGYQGQGYDQTNLGSGSSQNRQDIGNRSQQWRNDEHNRNRGSQYGQTEWRRRDVDYGNESSNHRNMGNN